MSSEGIKKVASPESRPEAVQSEYRRSVSSQSGTAYERHGGHEGKLAGDDTITRKRFEISHKLAKMLYWVIISK